MCLARVPVLLLVLAALASTAAACAGGLPDPLRTLSTQGCVKKNCSEADAVAYQACEASCRQQYGR